MTVKIAINGYGRIGRNVLRALYESGRTNELQVVAINDLGDANSNAHFPKSDPAHGQFPNSVEARDDALVGKKVEFDTTIENDTSETRIDACHCRGKASQRRYNSCTEL